MFTQNNEKKQKLPPIGAHVSASGGVVKAVDRAVAIEAMAMQVFSGSPRGWKRKPVAEIRMDKLYSKVQKLSFGPIVTHALYLVNLASDKPDLVEKSRKAVAYDLEFDAAVRGAGVVVHLGSHQGRGWAAVQDAVAQRLVQLINQAPAGSRLLIENSAGQNGKLSSDLSEIRWLLDTVRAELPAERHRQLGWCFDTCHAHAAGYALRPGSELLESAEAAAAAEKRGQPLQVAEQAISELKLWDDLACVHVNDSRDGFASGRDRHANLGQGQIPELDFQHFLQLKRWQDHPVPFILEVPGLDGKGPDLPNIQILKEWLGR